jgi:hypothetical protein
MEINGRELLFLSSVGRKTSSQEGLLTLYVARETTKRETFTAGRCIIHVVANFALGE